MANGANLWHSMEAGSVISMLESSAESGLDEKSIEGRQAKYGLNELKEKKKTSVFEIFTRQFKSLVVAALLLAALLSFFMEEYSDVVVIAAVLLVNASIGTFQEYRAEKALAALKKMSSTSARAIRNRVQHRLPATELVPGDIVLLEVGDRVPADCRIIESANLAVNESMFTGESVPAQKKAVALGAAVELSDRKNMVYKDTIVTAGRCKAIVVATGMKTEIGGIADKLQAEGNGTTPLQMRLSNFMKSLGIAVIFGVVLVVATGRFVAHLELEDLIRLSIAQTVSFIPEGLPIVVTIVLAVGVSAMAARKAIARRLSAVETLGCVTAICTDKTGTLTRNEMTVKEIHLDGGTISVYGSGYGTDGKLMLKGRAVNCAGNAQLSRLMKTAVLCNDAALENGDGGGVVGDPTEGALIVVAEKAGMKKEGADAECARIGEVQFDPEKKFMATFNREGKGISAHVKGAPEKVLEMCTHIMRNGKTAPLSAKERERIIEANHAMAGKALRVLGFACKKVDRASEKELRGMVFLGLTGMFDPPREEARAAIADCRRSGIKVVMITGDHKLTAIGIAKQLGMLADGSKSLTGTELSALSDEEFAGIVDDVVVYARMSSEHKMRIVMALKNKGHVVAMTGDGVNDALAIKKASIGIAMGLSGTEVTKESSDMVLADDNFATIVAAIEEGRGVYLNIQKVVSYLLSTNMGEVIFLFAVLLSSLYLPESLPLALLPIHILWVNLVTDGVCDVTLAMEPKEKGLIRQKPRDTDEPLITKKMAVFIAVTGVIMAMGTMAVFYTQYNSGGLAHARTMAFTTIAIFTLFSALNARSSQSIFSIGVFSNRYLTGAIIVSLLLQFGAIYLPFMNDMMQTTPLALEDWAVVFGVASTVLVAFEIMKFWTNTASPHAYAPLQRD